MTAGAVWLGACGDDGEPELTVEQQLEVIEGRPLSPSEIEDRLAVGETLCQMTDPVLDKIWFQLGDEQLEFQDLVFGRLCPDRSVFYAGKTGRFVTDEATESGVVTSTTRPSTTTSSSTTTSRPSTTVAAGAGTDSTDQSSDTSAGGSSTSTSSSTTATTSRSTTASTTTTTTTTTTTRATTASTAPAPPSTNVGEGG